MRVPLLEVEDLTVSYPVPGGRARAVRDFSLSVAAGEMVALVGETGCGKSSVALALAGLLAPEVSVSFRRLLFDGQALHGTRDWQPLRGVRLAMVFQDARGSLNPVLTVGAHLMQALRAHQRISRPEARRRSVELLKEVGLQEPDLTLRRYSFELSGGMCQRVGISLALCNHPSLMIADEPTSALDPTIQTQVLRLISRLRGNNGLAVLLVSHDLPLVAAFADRVAVMYHGSLAELGPAADVMRRPAHPYTRLLRESVPTSSASAGSRLPVIPGHPPSPVEDPPGCSFEPRCPIADAGTCRQSRPRLVEITPGHVVACVKPE